MRVLAGLLVGYRASGVQRLVRRSGLVRRLPAVLQSVETLAPQLRMASLRSAAPRHLAPVSGQPRLRVAMLTGCIQRAFFGDVNAATAAPGGARCGASCAACHEAAPAAPAPPPRPAGRGGGGGGGRRRPQAGP